MGTSLSGNILKTKRKERRLSVNEVVEQLHQLGIDIKAKTLYGWENGHRQADADTFLMLCQIYKIDSISEIQSGTKNESTPVSRDGLTKEQSEIVSLYEAAPPTLQAAALAVLKSAEGQGKAPDEAPASE